MSKKITIDFTEQQLQVLSSALVELPYKLAFPLISHINSEVQRNFDASIDAEKNENKNVSN